MENSRKNEILKIILRIDKELTKEFSQYSTVYLRNRIIYYQQQLKTA